MEKQLSTEDQIFFDQWNTIKNKAQNIQETFNKEIAPELEKYKVPGVSDTIKSIGKGIAVCGTIVTLAGIVMTLVNPVAGTTMKAIGKTTRSIGGTMIGTGTATNRGASAYQKFKRGDKKGGLIDLALAAAGVGTAIMAGKRLGSSFTEPNTNNMLNSSSALVNQTRGYLNDKIPISISSPDAPVNQIPSFINQTTGINNIDDLKFATAALDGENIVSTVEIKVPDGTEALAAVTDTGEIDIMNTSTGEVIESIPAEEVAQAAPEVVDTAVEIDPEETIIEETPEKIPQPIQIPSYEETDPNQVIYKNLPLPGGGWAKSQVKVSFAKTMDYISELNGNTGIHNIFGQNLGNDQIEILKLHPEININEVPPIFTDFENPNISDEAKISAFKKSLDYLKVYQYTESDFYTDMRNKLLDKAEENGFGIENAFNLNTFEHPIDYNLNKTTDVGDSYLTLSEYFSKGLPKATIPAVETAL